MPQRAQSKSADPPFGYSHQQQIDDRGLPAMQQMKPDAATVGIKNRIGQEMVEVDQICAGDNKSCTAPFVTSDNGRKQKRRYPMPAVVQDRLDQFDHAPLD